MATMTQTMGPDATSASFGHRWAWMLALGIVQIIAGGIAIAVPVVGSLAAVGIFGAVLILSAAGQLAYAFRIRSWPRSAWYGIGGALYAIAGLLVILYPIGGALALAIIIAALLIAEGGLRVMFAASARPAPGWGWLAAAGVGSILVGVILLLGWPLTAFWVTGLLLGINLIMSGATNAAVAVTAGKRMTPASAAINP